MQANSRSKIRQVTSVALLSLCACALSAFAAGETLSDSNLWDTVKNGKPMTNFRLRYEHVDQDGKPENARALTLRSLIGWQTAPFHDFSIGVQLINVAKLENRYDDRRLGDPEKGMGNYPVIVDPHDTDINQLYVDWNGINDTRFRIGRQQVNLDNVRFIGDIGFRQVMQVFDGYSVLNKSLPDTEIYLAHFERVKQISTRLQEGELEIINVKYRFSPAESITGYGYLSNFETPSMAKTSVLGPDTDQSHKTLGLRLDGSRRINGDWRWLYTVEYARQTDYSNGDERIDAHYGHVGIGTGYKSWFARIDHERLSSNDSEYAFQTPFGTNHLFQGWTDHFLITPTQGIRDTFITVGGKPLPALTLHAEYHIIDADENFAKFGGGFGDRYGKELDLAATWNINSKLLLKAEYANFREDDRIANPIGRKTDIEKAWLTAMYTF
ncbi:MAG TPA: alginate export family protein [Methylophilaceae bacterium]